MVAKTRPVARSVKKNTPHVQMFPMIMSNLPAVLQVEEDSFNEADTWGEKRMLCVLHRRNVIGKLVVQDGRVVGFMIYELHKSKLQLLKFAVAPAERRAGIGACMVANLVGRLSLGHRTRITLRVRETNKVAQRFFKAQGFNVVRTLPNFYGKGNACLLLEYKLAGAEAEAPMTGS